MQHSHAKTPTYIHSNKNSHRFTHLTHTNIQGLPHAAGSLKQWMLLWKKTDCMPIFTVCKYVSLCKRRASSENHTESNTHHRTTLAYPCIDRKTASTRPGPLFTRRTITLSEGHDLRRGHVTAATGSLSRLSPRANDCVIVITPRGDRYVLTCWPQHFRQCDGDGKWHGLITHARRGMISWVSVPVIVGWGMPRKTSTREQESYGEC